MLPPPQPPLVAQLELEAAAAESWPPLPQPAPSGPGIAPSPPAPHKLSGPVVGGKHFLLPVLERIFRERQDPDLDSLRPDPDPIRIRTKVIFITKNNFGSKPSQRYGMSS